MIKREFGENVFEETMKKIMDCLKYRTYINVFRMDTQGGGTGMDLAILKALLTGKIIFLVNNVVQSYYLNQRWYEAGFLGPLPCLY